MNGAGVRTAAAAGRTEPAPASPARRPPEPTSEASRRIRWSLLFGNFVIGCGVMCVVGTLNDLTRSLDVSVSLGGQLLSAAAAVMCFGAPLLAGWVAGFDRRRLLALSLVWYGVGHAASALMPSFAALLAVRAATVLGAAVFTPQAAAAIGHMTPASERGQAITFIFLGWSVASVAGMPLAAWLGETFGWRSAFRAASYFGQGAGASSGGWLIAHAGWSPLSWAGAAWLGASIALSIRVGRRRVATR